MMKRGQTGIGLVLLGVIAIIAVIGLVLLFTRASTSGGAVYYPQQNAVTQSGIGDNYGYNAGIGSTTGTPKSVPGQPMMSYPAPPGYPGTTTKGARTPAFIVRHKGSKGYASIENYYGCMTDLHAGAGILAPGDTFNAYTIPIKGTTYGQGNYPIASSAYGEWQTKFGGTVLAFANSVGGHPNSENLIRENLITRIKAKGGKLYRHDWEITSVNNKEVAVCWVSEQQFPFAQ